MANFLGVPYPIIKHARGYLHTQSGSDQIRSDLLSLILTNRGERVMLPMFGVDLRRFLFEPNDVLLANQVREAIIQQITRWEPRVVIEQIDVISRPDRGELNSQDDLTEQDATLLIRILFLDPGQIQEVQELVLEVPLSGV